MAVPTVVGGAAEARGGGVLSGFGAHGFSLRRAI